MEWGPVKQVQERGEEEQMTAGVTFVRIGVGVEVGAEVHAKKIVVLRGWA